MKKIFFFLAVLLLSISAYSSIEKGSEPKSEPSPELLKAMEKRFSYVEYHAEDGTVSKMTVKEAVKMGLDLEEMNICANSGWCSIGSMPDCPEGQCAECVYIWRIPSGYCDWRCITEEGNQ
jgi:hypothetical protein